MILSVSRRTDIPCYYTDWFMNRLKEGYAITRNPMNYKQVKRVEINPDIVDCIVFWTKNPAPMLDRLDEIKEFGFYFQYTLNSYGQDIEPLGGADRSQRIAAFKRLSEEIGKHRVIWRYDPVLLNEKYTKAFHYREFAALAKALSGSAEKCVVSFVDMYRKISRSMGNLGIAEVERDVKLEVMERFAAISREYGLRLETCIEPDVIGGLNIHRTSCIDPVLIERITGRKRKVVMDSSQRPGCNCIKSTDIGAYNTCLNGCIYCYANYNQGVLKRNYGMHNPNSPILIGEFEE